MRILIDIGHPAHVHYFKNFIWIMKKKAHEFLITARDKEVTHQLLNHYQIPYKSRGKGADSLAGKLFYMFYSDYIILREGLVFKPDLILSFASTYAAHVSYILKVPHIVLDDTEHAKLELMMYPPFSETILNPSCFSKKFSSKQLFFDSYMELSYLHPNYFYPDSKIIEKYGLNVEDPFFILRFISWKASHDRGHSGISMSKKTAIITKLEKHGRVLITSENTLPEKFEKYRININPAHLHYFLFYTSLYIGEGATTASECVMLGTPAIYINSLDAGTLSEQSKNYGLVSLRNADSIEEIIEEKTSNLPKKNLRIHRNTLIKDKIDLTAFLTWFVESYPVSKNIMKINPNYQYNFR